MSGQNTSQNGQAAVHAILKKVVELFRAGKHTEAAQLLKKTLEKYPNQKEFLTLLAQMREKLKELKIKKLEEEALTLIRGGAEDEAQCKLREILELDPSRTDLKDSLKKTQSELRREQVRRYNRLDNLRIALHAVLVVLAICFVLAVWGWWDNHRHLKRAEKAITRGQYGRAKVALEDCGWFMAGEKSRLRKEIQKTVKDLWDEAIYLGSIKEYNKAINCLNLAWPGADDAAKFQEKVEEFRELNRLKAVEVAKEREAGGERQRLAQEVFLAATKARGECQKAAATAGRNNAESNAPDLWREAADLAAQAGELMDAEKVVEAEKTWRNAVKKYEEASIAAVGFDEQRRSAYSARDKCEEAAQAARGAYGKSSATELWAEAGDLATRAAEYLQAGRLGEAEQGWLEATKKYGEVLAAAQQSKPYRRATLILRKWERLKVGLSETEIRDILGPPKCVQGASDECVWYYQHEPKLVEDGSAPRSCTQPDCGYVRLAAVDVNTILRNLEDANQARVDKLVATHENGIRVIEYNHEKRVEAIERELRYARGRRRTALYRQIHEENQDYEERLEQTETTYERILEKYEDKHNRKVAMLVNGLEVREPVYRLAEWRKPDEIDLLSYVPIEEPNLAPRERRTTKWHMPLNWRRLKLNINEEQAHKMIGSPKQVETNGQERVELYGDVPGYGLAIFALRKDSTRRLDYWKQPLWSAVEHGN